MIVRRNHHSASEQVEPIFESLPANLDVDNLLEEHPPAFSDNRLRDKLVYMLRLIHSIPARHKAETLKEGYTRISSKRLKKISKQ